MKSMRFPLKNRSMTMARVPACLIL
jgi:hypothetical protein